MASWNSIPLEISYHVLGWISCFCWTFCFYPQYLLNYRRKSVVGLNFDFLLLNVMKQSFYLMYNAPMYFSPVVQMQYHVKYGYGEPIPVAANDVAFSIHAVVSKVIVGVQILIYERGNQTVSRTCISIISAMWAVAVVCTLFAWPKHSWLWLISVFNSMQVFMTIIKNFPQAFMNFVRKSTEGFSIGSMLLQLVGGLAGLAQLGVQSIDDGSFVNFYANIGKTLLSLEVVLFSLLFIFQHYVLYPHKEEKNYSKFDAENTAPLLKTYHKSPQSEIV